MTSLPSTATEPWRALAHERRLRSVRDERAFSLRGQASGSDVSIEAFEDEGFVTRARSVPRLPLCGTVLVRPARPIERALRWRRFASLGRAFSVRRTSESVARTVLDERVVRTLVGLGPRLRVLAYTPREITLAWRGIEESAAVLDDALACVAYLAAGFAVSPYRG